jgi:hypothetical protein
MPLCNCKPLSYLRPWGVFVKLRWVVLWGVFWTPGCRAPPGLELLAGREPELFGREGWVARCGLLGTCRGTKFGVRTASRLAWAGVEPPEDRCAPPPERSFQKWRSRQRIWRKHNNRVCFSLDPPSGQLPESTLAVVPVRWTPQPGLGLEPEISMRPCARRVFCALGISA